MKNSTAKLFGQLATRKKWTSFAAVQDALRRQAKLKKQHGRQVRLGEILLKQGRLSLQDVIAILQLQGIHVFACHQCKRQYNVHQNLVGDKWLCQQCGQVLYKPKKVRSIRVVGDLPATQSPEKGKQGLNPFTPEGLAAKAAELYDEIVIPDNYELVGEVSRGGMGVIYKVRQPNLERYLALKMLISGIHATPEERERFFREARATAKLHHTNIVAIHDIGTYRGRPYFTMDFIAGRSLQWYIEHDPLPLESALRIIQKIAQALEYAHSKMIVHRDIKPSNILLDENGEPKLTDFGIAKDLQVDIQKLTESGIVMGSPCYMSPEQALGKQVDARSDIYSLGAVMYELLVGHPPFEGPTAIATIKLLIEEDPVPPRTRNPAISQSVEAICMKALCKSPARRYHYAHEMANDIDRYFNHLPVAALRQYQFMHKHARGRWQVWVVAFIPFLFLLLASIYVISIKRREYTIQCLLQQANSALSNNKYQLAQRSFQRVLVLNPKNTSAITGLEQLRVREQRRLEKLLEQAREALDAKNYQRALQWLEEARSYSQDARIMQLYRFAKGLGHLKISTYPPGAQVCLQAIEPHSLQIRPQQRVLGITPLAVDLKQGLYELILTSKGIPALHFPIKIQPDRVGARHIKLYLVTPPQGMVFIPQGSFLFGRNHEERELPAFWCDRTEVTNRMYAQYVHATGSPAPDHWLNGAYPPGEGDLPVTRITWYEAAGYAQWVGKRLPDENEWEKAARGIDGRLYPWGNELRMEYANINTGAQVPRLLPVTSKPAGRSPYGCWHMVGNVAEWTATSLNKNRDRVIRGGSYVQGTRYCTCIKRQLMLPSGLASDVGFRCVRSFIPLPPGGDPLPVLIRAYQSSNVGIRIEAIRQLVQLHQQRAYETILRALGDSNREVRARTMYTLQFHGHRALQDFLFTAFQRSNKLNRYAQVNIALYLSKIQYPGLLEIILRMLSNHRSTWLLAALGNLKDPTTVNVILPLLRSRYPPIVAAAAKALADIGATSSIPSLLWCLHHPHPFVRQEAVNGLGHLGLEEVVPHLVPLLKDPSPSVRGTTAQVLGELKAQQALKPLMRTLHDGVSWVARKAISAIGQLKNPAAVEALGPFLYQNITRKNLTLHINVCQALRMIGSRKAIPFLLEELRKGHPTSSFYAVQALRVITGQSFGFIPEAPLSQRQKIVRQWEKWWQRQARHK